MEREEVAAEAPGFTLDAPPARRDGGGRRRSATRVRVRRSGQGAKGRERGGTVKESPGGGKRPPPDEPQGVNYFDVLMGRASKPRRAAAEDVEQTDVSLEAGVSSRWRQLRA